VSHVGKVSQSDPRAVLVHFPQGVRSAFSDLAASVHFSDHFDRETLPMLNNWAAGKPVTLEEFVLGMHEVAGELLKHVKATGDERARAAWEEIGGQLIEHGFTIAKRRVRGG
jgi:hypothetical protein